MRRVIFFLLLVLAVSCSGCTRVLKIWYGIHNPEFETHESLVKFHEEAGFGEVPYIGLGYDSWQQKKLFRSPDVFVFDSKGRFIPYRDATRPNCNGPAEDFLAQLNKDRTYFYSDAYSLTTFLDLMEGSQCTPLTIDTLSTVDFYVFFTIARFGGKKIVKEKSAIWFHSLRNNKTISCKIFLVNQDLKNCWSDEQKKMLGTD